MLDGVLKKQIEPVLDVIGAALAARGVTANAVTYAGLGIGLGAAAAIAVGAYRTGLVLLLVSRLADGLDGAVARITQAAQRSAPAPATAITPSSGPAPTLEVWHRPGIEVWERQPDGTMKRKG